VEAATGYTATATATATSTLAPTTAAAEAEAEVEAANKRPPSADHLRLFVERAGG